MYRYHITSNKNKVGSGN